MKYGFEEKNHSFETKYGFAKNKKNGCSLYSESFSQSMDLQTKMMGINNVMKDLQEVWI